jgi:hypothetical protein
MKGTTMRYLFLVVVTVLLAAGQAFACAPNCPVDPVPVHPADNQLSLIASQAQQQGQNQSVGNTSATGGSLGPVSNVATTGASTSAGGQGGNASDQSQSSTRVYVAPPPVGTSVPQAAGCIVTHSLAGSVGWSFVSASGTEQYTDTVCSNMNLAEAEYRVCHYYNAEVIRIATYKLLNPKAPELVVNEREVNLTYAECHAAPVVLVAPVVVKRAPKPATGPCAKPGGVRKADGCHYPKPDCPVCVK